jgi:FAD/FMN-containing dehydrogenase
MTFLEELRLELGPDKVAEDTGSRRRLSRDFFRYSQVLTERLEDRMADAIVFPAGEDDVVRVLSLAVRHGAPVTARGAGTGNYGQAVPLEGGVVLDMTRMPRILGTGDGWMRAQAGARLGVMEKEAAREGQGLRIFPSTYLRSTVGGFVAGGSAGIGSVTHGQLWDGNVLGARLVTADDVPRAVEVSGAELEGVIHAYGTTGVLTELTMALAPQVPWTQAIAAFDTLDAALTFSDALSRDDGVRKRLVCVCEAGIAPLLNAASPLFEEPYRHVVLLWVALDAEDATRAAARAAGGEVVRTLPYGKHPTLSDMSWNHTTLWARKVDPTWTYLQAGFDADRVWDQSRAVKQRYGDEVLLHFEYMRAAGRLVPTSLPLLRYRSKERIDEIIAFMQSIGIGIANPHTWVLEDGGRRRQDWARMYEAKRRYDPAGILNPGKLRGPEREAV